MTYGQVKLRLTKAFPSVDPELIEGWIQDRYVELLAELPWQRQNVEAILVTTAPYTTGTVALTKGSDAVTLTDGTWTSDMTGLAFRAVGRSEFYAFTFASASTGTLDRPYEGSNSAAATYSIWQSIYPLPADARLLQQNAFSSPYGPMKQFTHGELNQSDPWRLQSGTPGAWAIYMDDASTPPRMQVELWPVPNVAIGLPFAYTAEVDPLSSTSTVLQVWLQPTALIEGVNARVKGHLKDYQGALYHAGLAEKALVTMRKAEAHGMAPARMQLDSYYTGYRMRRGSR